MDMERVVGDYILGRQIGSGSFSVVRVARHRVRGTEVAVKDIAIDKLGKKLRECLLSEIAILKKISHPNIIALHDIIEASGRIYLVLEYCRGGDLSMYIRRHGRVPESTAKHFMHQLATGLQVLREHNLIHRDLKPQNLLLTTCGDNSVLKIADFGFARSLHPRGLAETLCGSPLYMAPEIMQLQKYDAKADLWSVGAILYQLVTGKTPFTGTNQIQLLQNIMKSNELHFPPDNNLSCDCIDLCLKLLRRNPVERLTFKEFFDHQFLSQHLPDQSLRHMSLDMKDASPLIESGCARPSGESSQEICLSVHLDEKSSGQDGKLLALKSRASIRSTHGLSVDNEVVKIPLCDPSNNVGVLPKCTSFQKEQEKISCSQISSGRYVEDTTASRKASAIADSLEIVDQDYVLVPVLQLSSSVNDLGPRKSPGKLDVESQKCSSSSAAVPITGREINNMGAIRSLENQSSPVSGTSQGSVDTRGITEQPSACCVMRIKVLQQCASLIVKLVHKEVANGRQLEAFSVQLVVLAVWKQIWWICYSQAPSATEGSPSQEVGSRESTEAVPSIRECCSSIDSTWSEAFRSQISRDFVAEIEYADELAKELAQMGQFDENRDMPDAIELIFQFALTFGRNGAVHEMMENLERAAAQYSKSIRLLQFLLVEASPLDRKSPMTLTSSDRCRLRSYIGKLGSRHDHCRSGTSGPSKSDNH